MTSQNQSLEEKLAQRTHAVLRQLPPAAAPPTLAARVLHEIAARASRPAPTAGITHRPLLVRLALAAVCIVCVPIAGALATSLRAQLADSLVKSGALHVLQTLRGVGDTALLLATLAGDIARAIPPAWLFGGLLASGALYALLSSLGYLVVRYTAPPHTKVRSI